MTAEEFNRVFDLAQAEAKEVMSRPETTDELRNNVIKLKREDPTTENSDVLTLFATTYAQYYADALVYNILNDLLVD